MVSPLLPLPRSLPALVSEAIGGETDFRPSWKWPILTPRVGPWELVVQMCVGASASSGHTTGRIYVALDAGFGAYLIVLVDRDPQKLAERYQELLAIMAGAQLLSDRRADLDADTDLDADADLEPAADRDAVAKERRAKPAAPPAPVSVIPPQSPPAEIYLKEALFNYLTD
jgi:hypothetical protein